jgi:catechol 2,3-dioxygenase-like lactoylglutathione lyase family enzyme
LISLWRGCSPGRSAAAINRSAATKGAQMLRGLTTVNFWAADMAAAKKWYTELLGFGPYFERPLGVEPPQYVEWRLGDYQHELGLIDRKYSPAGSATSPGGVVAYWHVDDVAATFAKLPIDGFGW